KARGEAQSIIERARAEIERERDAAIAEIRRESVDLALAAATRLVQENLDQEKDRVLVERYLTELGGAGGEV
ncbi:MAG TPA: ATP F0F1 synthase subunit B, partial [Gemmatimonadetes bacterium]|nr:ATP F0F1 synthase subunit B [Gemmatimonadota bacterium]